MENIFMLIAVSLATVSGQKVSLGRCPDATPLSELNVSEYLGKWYEIYRIGNIFEIDQTCDTANYSLKADGHVKVFNAGVSGGRQVNATGDAFIPDPSKPAQLSVKFNENSPYAPYWVLDTDYKGYTVIFSCEALEGLLHAQFAWILSRTPTISDSVKNAAFQTLEKNGVDTSSLQKNVQNGCPGRK